MKKVYSVILLICLVITFTACTKHPDEITIDQAEAIAYPYFYDLYGKKVVVEEIELKFLGMNDDRNIIHVSDGETNYSLCLDVNNKPLFDNVSVVDIAKAVDAASLGEKLKPLGLELHDYYDIEWRYSLKHERCFVSFSAVLRTLPNNDLRDDIYAFLGSLRNQGIDDFWINLNSPVSVFPIPEDGYKHGLNIYGVRFSTSISEDVFDKEYSDFVNGIYWNEQKFKDIITELTLLGYKNAYFYITRWDGNSIEVVLYCESDDSLSDEQIATLLDDIDDSYIRIDGASFKFVIEHIVG